MAKRKAPLRRRRILPRPDDRWSEADARRVLAAWRDSGLPLWTFARRHGLHGQRLAYWNKRLKDWSWSGLELVSAAALVPAELVVEQSVPAWPAAVLRLPRGVLLELSGASPAWVAGLIDELTRQS